MLLLSLAQDDGLSMADMELMLDSFKGQPLDFFGAMRSATYDNQIRDWIKEIVEDDIDADGANLQELTRRLINRRAPQSALHMRHMSEIMPSNLLRISDPRPHTLSHLNHRSAAKRSKATWHWM